MEVRWSTSAFKDLERIFERIRKDNSAAAEKVVNTIYNACAALQTFPNSGRIGRMKGRRELVLAPLPYIVVYRVKEHAVEISRVYQGAQHWP